MKLLFVFMFLMSCASATEELRYKIIKKEGKKEVRLYEPYLMASVVFKTQREMDRKGFRILADYIFGNNISMTSPVLSQGEDIGMTAPVFTAGEDIGMTSPVFTNQDEYKMTFVMPARYTINNLPRPNNEQIIIEEVPSRQMAAIQFNGRRSQARNIRFAKELKAWIRSNGMELSSAAVYAGYNPPWTLPVFRRNEVLFVVE